MPSVAALSLLLCLASAPPDAGRVELPPRDFYAAALASPPPPRVTAEQLHQWLGEGSATVIDLRSKEAFAAKHLHGAINIPVTELTEATLRQVLPSKTARLVTYCDDQLFPTRRVALTTLGVPSLRALGYTDVRLLEDLWMRADARAGSASPSPGGLQFDTAPRAQP